MYVNNIDYSNNKKPTIAVNGLAITINIVKILSKIV